MSCSIPKTDIFDNKIFETIYYVDDWSVCVNVRSGVRNVLRALYIKLSAWSLCYANVWNEKARWPSKSL